MSLIASLPWYDLPDTEENYDMIWAVLRSQLVARGIKNLPVYLDRKRPLTDQWKSPGLVISQSCGLDLFTDDGADLIPIARPVFADLDCEPGNYFSYIVTAHSGFEQPNAIVVNSFSSRSGCTSLLEWMAGRYEIPPEIIVSGSHDNSMRILNAGLADLGAVDAHSFEWLESDGITIIGQTNEAPAPPFVAHRDSGIERDLLFEALQETFKQIGYLVGIKDVISAEYDSYSQLKPDAERFHQILENYT